MSTPKPTAAELPTFVMKAPTSFWWEVRIPIPTDSDYSFAKLDVLFAALPQPELDRFKGLDLQPGEALPSEADICRRVVKGWRNLPDEQGNPVPYSAQALEDLMAAPMVRSVMVATYMAATSGMAARKNA